MSYRTIKNFEELAKELKEVNPKTKEEVTMMIDNYSLELLQIIKYQTLIKLITIFRYNIMINIG